MNLPKWAVIALITLGVILVVVIFKINIHGNIGSDGITAGITQGSLTVK